MTKNPHLRVYVANAGTYGTLAVAGNASLPAAAAIGVTVADCGAIAPGNVIAGVMTSANPIVASGFTVTDNCAKLAFIAVVNANGQAIDLVVVNDAREPIPTLTDLGRASLALVLALAALVAIHRRSAAPRACRVPRPRS
jgi:MinD-like ATPase involved in chromosome partitioning or flagellar assembly